MRPILHPSPARPLKSSVVGSWRWRPKSAGRRLLAPLAWLALATGPLRGAEDAAALPRVSADGRSLEFAVPGLGELRCGWAAGIEKAGVLLRLDSGGSGLGLPGAVATSQAEGIRVAIPSPEADAELLFQLRLEDGSALRLRAGVRNLGREPFQLIDTAPLAARIRIGEPAGWLLTGLHPRTALLAPLPRVGERVAIHEHGTFYQPDGLGFTFGPVGEPVTRWASGFEARSATLAIDLGEEAEIAGVFLSEIEWPETREFRIEVKRGGDWREVARGTTLGADKSISFPPLRAREIRLNVLKAERAININEFQVIRAR